MPIRRRANKPRKNVTLNEALNLIAFESICGPVPGPAAISAEMLGDVDVEALKLQASSQQQKLEIAKDDFFNALRDGDLPAEGRFSCTYSNNWQANEWTQQPYEYHSDKRTEIPAEFWRREGMDWSKSCARSPTAEYVDIILSLNSVLFVWPLDGAQEGEDTASDKEELVKQTGIKRGRRAQYPENDFYALCALETDLNGLPEIQAAMVERMAQLLGVIWGDDRVPGETWLKEKISRIYKLKEKYEAGRQMIQKK